MVSVWPCATAAKPSRQAVKPQKDEATKGMVRSQKVAALIRQSPFGLVVAIDIGFDLGIFRSDQRHSRIPPPKLAKLGAIDPDIELNTLG